MTTQTTKAAGRIGGLPMGDSLGGRALLSAPHVAALLQGVKLAELRQRADAFKRAGDYEAFCTARRAFLLAQAEAWITSHEEQR